jgi:hypothetical protein
MSSIAIELSHLRAVEQAQQPLEFAVAACGGVELEGKSASIKSSSECIQSSNAISFSSCILRCSAAGSRRQLRIRNNERKGDNDEPDPPLLLDRELAVGEGDVVIRRKQSNQANNCSNDGFQQGFAIEPNRHQGGAASRSRKAPSTLSSPTRPRQPAAQYTSTSSRLLIRQKPPRGSGRPLEWYINTSAGHVRQPHPVSARDVRSPIHGALRHRREVRGRP